VVFASGIASNWFQNFAMNSDPSMRDCIEISNSDLITLLLEAREQETTNILVFLPLLSPSTKLLFVGAQLVLLDRDLETFLVDITIGFILRLLEKSNYAMHHKGLHFASMPNEDMSVACLYRYDTF
jgi:hypothetical protein